MKKVLMVFALVAIIATGTAFADHPDGFGIGVEGAYGTTWGSWGGYSNAALTLKFAGVPIYLGIGADITVSSSEIGFGLMVYGDYYFIDMPIVSNILHWYLGAGVQATLGFGASGAGAGIKVGVLGRLPIGLSLQIPVSSVTLEFYLAAIPNIGVTVIPFHFPAGGIGGAAGFRLWF